MPAEISGLSPSVQPEVRGRPVPLWLAELVRSLLAILLVGMFGITVWLSFAGAAKGCSLETSCWANVKELLQLLLPAESALLGTALGYYFGTTSIERSPASN